MKRWSVFQNGQFHATYVAETQVEALDAFARGHHYRDFTALVIDRADPDRVLDCQSPEYQARIDAVESTITVKKVTT